MTGEYLRAIDALDQKLWPKEPSVNAAPMIVVGSSLDGELWLAIPDAHLAFPYEGEYRITQEQKNAERVLIEKGLAKMEIERVGILLLDAQGVDFERVRYKEGRPLDEVITSAPLTIDASGTVRVPSDFDADPFFL